MDTNQVSSGVQNSGPGASGGSARLVIAVVVLIVLFGIGYLWLGGSSTSTQAPLSSESAQQTGVNETPFGGGSAVAVPDSPVGSVPEMATGTPTTGVYTLADVAKHGTPESCWLASAGGVYDVTTFIGKHPGGEKILQGCGKDMTEFFASKHAKQSREQLPAFKIGVLK
jgi:cytochrome b involved in lipid metabolism